MRKKTKISFFHNFLAGLHPCHLDLVHPSVLTSVVELGFFVEIVVKVCIELRLKMPVV